jgi:ribosomal protein S24E
METKNGKPALRCLIRKKLIIETPEELVRQDIIKKLIDFYDVPEDMIQVEMKVNKYGDYIESNDRADIIVEYLTVNEDAKLLKPIVVIECKQQNTPLT